MSEIYEHAWEIDGIILASKNQEKNLCQSHYVHHKSYRLAWNQTQVSVVASQTLVQEPRHSLLIFKVFSPHSMTYNHKYVWMILKNPKLSKLI
jgi:hypothetical protein